MNPFTLEKIDMQLAGQSTSTPVVSIMVDCSLVLFIAIVSEYILVI